MALIVIEGLDGAGKSTQISLISNFLNKQGVSTEYLHFPRLNAPFFGELISRFLRGELGNIDQVDPYVVAMLYAADRMDASETIKGWLNVGKMVLLDRYVYSNIAFQCAKIGSKQDADKLRNWIFQLEYDRFKIPKPDLNIFLDVPFDFTKKRLSEKRVGEDRSYLQGKDDIHEKDLSFQERVRQVYLSQEPIDQSFKIINCCDTHGEMHKPETIFNAIISVINANNLY